MSALNKTQLAPSQFIPVSAGAIYDQPASTIANIRGLWLHNTSTTLVQRVRAYNVPSAAGPVLGTPTAVHQFCDVDLQPRQALDVSIPGPGLYLPVGIHNAIFADATTVSTVTVQVIGDSAS